MAQRQEGFPHGAAHRPAGSGDSVGSDSQSDNAVTLAAQGATGATPAPGQSEPETGNPRTDERIRRLLAERDAALALVAQLKDPKPMTTQDDTQMNDQTAPPPAMDPKIAAILAREEVMESLPHLTRAQATEVVSVVQRLGSAVTHEEAAILAARAKPELFPSAPSVPAARANAQAFTPQAPQPGSRTTASQEIDQQMDQARSKLARSAPGTGEWLQASATLQRLDMQKAGKTLR